MNGTEHFEFRRLYKLDPDIVPDKESDEKNVQAKKLHVK
jgi:hypothetical protein